MANTLQAINEVLQRLGKLPVKRRDIGGTSTHAHVERMINNASDMVQGQGWNWNTKTEQSIASNTTTATTMPGNLQVNNLEVVASKIINDLTLANPCVLEVSSHGYTTGDEVYIENCVGTTELNGRVFTITNVSTDFLELDGEDSTNHTTYVSAGQVAKSQHIYHVDTVGGDGHKNYIRRGGRMYDEANDTFTITGTTNLGWIYQFDFDDVPDSFQKWIIALAAYDFNRYYIGNQSHDQLLLTEIADAKRQATREEIRAVDIDVLNQQPMRQIRGRQRMPDRSIY